MAVTIYDVAKEAGVSAMTVSMALRGDKRVRESTRQRVLEMARRLGYTPNTVARALVSGRTRTVGVYCQRVYGVLAARFVSAFGAGAAEADYAVTLFDAPAGNGRVAEAIGKFRGAKVEGMALVATRLATDVLAQVLQPPDRVVLMNHTGEGLQVDAVWIDDAHAGREAARHLIGLGHKRIAFVGGREDDHSMAAYLDGYRSVLREAGQGPRDEFITFSPGDWFESVPRSVERLLKRDPRPSAIVCPHDRVALLAAVAARRAGLRVPEDVAIVGHYDLPDARLAEAPLTTFDVQVDQIGRVAFELLYERLTGKRDEPKQIRIEPKLIVRASCGASPT